MASILDFCIWGRLLCHLQLDLGWPPNVLNQARSGLKMGYLGQHDPVLREYKKFRTLVFDYLNYLSFRVAYSACPQCLRDVVALGAGD